MAIFYFFSIPTFDFVPPQVYAFNTFFYPTLIKDGYSRLKRWTRKVDLFSYDIVLIPVHLQVYKRKKNVTVPKEVTIIRKFWDFFILVGFVKIDRHLYLKR